MWITTIRLSISQNQITKVRGDIGWPTLRSTTSCLTRSSRVGISTVRFFDLTAVLDDRSWTDHANTTIDRSASSFIGSPFYWDERGKCKNFSSEKRPKTTQNVRWQHLLRTSDVFNIKPYDFFFSQTKVLSSLPHLFWTIYQCYHSGFNNIIC